MNQPSNQEYLPSEKEEKTSSKDQEPESEYSQLQSEELEKTFRTLKKLHRIDDQRKLTKLKQKPQVNQVFKSMSEFFHRPGSKKALMIQKQKERIQQLKKMKESLVNKPKVKKIKKRHFFLKIQKEKKFLIQELNNEPEIFEQESSSESAPNIDESELSSSQSQINSKFHSNTRCHICKKSYKQIHFFYHRLCPPCAVLNMTKRNSEASMVGLTALVTGGRIKIGYEIALKMLRSGAIVYVTTRFSHDTTLRYQKQSDYEEWKDKLHIIQSDFVSSSQVARLIEIIRSNVTKLDILINNAAQTIVRPKEFYSIQLENQRKAISFPNQNCFALQNISDNSLQVYPSLNTGTALCKKQEIDLENLDEFGQPTDKRNINSWVQKLQDVSLVDCYTTQLINSIVPFHLISELKSLMIGSTPSWIINVSSMEGVFYKNVKQEFHPHTNMAKAALNMITRTSAAEFKEHQIFMNSVDTGWVTNQNPYPILTKMAEDQFRCPLDCVDGAMRVLDPIYMGLNQKEFPFGKFWKDYKESFW